MVKDVVHHRGGRVTIDCQATGIAPGGESRLIYDPRHGANAGGYGKIVERAILEAVGSTLG